MNALTRTIGLTVLGLACLVGAEELELDVISVTAFLYMIGGTFTVVGGFQFAKMILGRKE